MSILTVVMLAGGITIYYGFSRRKIWAFRLASVQWVFLIIVCGFIATLDIMAAVKGNFMSGLMALLLIFIIVGMVRRFSTFSNPIFVAWYLGNANQIIASGDLQEGEMLAACRHCLSILAVKPLELSQSDNCPNCGEGLVSPELVEKLALEEE